MDTPSTQPSRAAAAPARPGGRQLLLAFGLGSLVLVLSAGAAWLVRNHLRRPAPPATPGQDGSGPTPRDERALVGRGRLLYGIYCANCHGPEGHGDGPSASGLKSPPRDFAAAGWKHGATPAAVRRVIAEGVPGTPMPASARTLSPADVDALTAYVLTLGPRSDAAGLPAALRTRLERAGLSPLGGRAAPDLELLDGGGARTSLSRFRGKVVLLVLWETTCVPCLEKLPTLEQLAAEHRDRGLAVFPVCLNEAEAKDLGALGARHAKSLPLYLDARGVARLRYDVQGVPAAFLIGRDGQLLGGGPGPGDWASPEVRELLRVCLAPGPG
jgi:mono/diheme cytochrome c family protein/peroxiredoxin